MEKLCLLLLTFGVFHANAISTGTAVANNNQFPYAVSIQREIAAVPPSTVPTWAHHCNGVAVTLQHILTAASCFEPIPTIGGTIQIVASSLRVLGGSFNLAFANPVVRTVASFTNHPSFIPTPAHVSDISVITLTTAFPNTTVTPLALPTASFRPADKTDCVVAGWGQTLVNQPATGLPVPTPSQILISANKYIYNQDLCRNVYSTIAGSPNVLSGMVCAASNNIVSVGCNGDEGAALVCDDTLTGLLFYHNNCQALAYPELYTRVSNHTAWIRSITGSASAIAPGAVLFALMFALQLLFKY